MTARATVAWVALFATSFGIHAVGFARLAGDGGADAARKRKPELVEMTVAERPAPPTPPAPTTPAPAAPPASRRLAMRAAKVAAPAPAAKAAPPPEAPVAETPADFTGTTLTNDGPGAGWASATGNGATMNGPIGRPGAKITGRQVEGVRAAPQRNPGPATVAAADLSRAPEAPRLDDALAANYPAEARQKGLAGKAVVRGRVMPDGRMRELAIVSESAPGFGRACQATLADSRWTAPLDGKGQPVATIIQYTCRFDVR